MVAIVEMITAANVMEVARVVYMEIAIAVFAAMVYFTMTGWLAPPPKSRSKPAPLSNRSNPDQAAQEPLNTDSAVKAKVVTALRQGRLSDAIRFLQQWPEAKEHVPASVAPRLLMAAAKVPDVETSMELMEMKVFSGKIEARSLEAVVLEAMKNKDNKSACQLYAIAEQLAIPKTQRTLETFARLFASDMRVLQALVGEADAPMGKTFAKTVLEACIALKDVDLAAEVFEKVAESDAAALRGIVEKAATVAAPHRPPTPPTSSDADSCSRRSFHGLLSARVSARDRHGAWKLVEEMHAAGLSPTAATCSILLKLKLNTATDVTRVIGLITTMKEPMDAVLFSALADACIRSGQLDLLCAKTSSFTFQEGSSALLAPTYGSLIKAFGQEHNVRGAWSLWNDMIQRSVSPTAITLGCMIEALVANGYSVDAWQFVQKLWDDENTRHCVNIVTYSTILKGFANAKDPEKVMAVYEEMHRHGLQPNNITYNTMLNAFAQCGAMHRVPALLQEMKAADPPIEPDLVTYSTIVKGYCSSGSLDRGLQVYKDMQSDGKHAPDEVMYNSLLDGCAREHRPDDALRLVVDMKRHGVAPSNYTLSMLVKLMGRCKRLEQAFALIAEISHEYSLKVNIQVYTCLIQACFNNRQANKAVTVHDQIIKEGVLPDEMTYTVLVQGCLKAGLTEKAVQLARSAYSHDSAPGVSARCLSDLSAALGPNGQELVAEFSANRTSKSNRSGQGKGCSKGSGASPPWRQRA